MLEKPFTLKRKPVACLKFIFSYSSHIITCKAFPQIFLRASAWRKNFTKRNSNFHWKIFQFWNFIHLKENFHRKHRSVTASSLNCVNVKLFLWGKFFHFRNLRVAKIELKRKSCNTKFMLMKSRTNMTFTS